MRSKKRHVSRHRALTWTIGVTAMISLSGCSPTSLYTKGAKIAFQAVGDAVHEADVEKYAERLLGKPEQEARVAFGEPRETFEETQSGRMVYVYPVEGDALSRFGWVIECDNDRIVAVSKVQKENPSAMGIAKSIIAKEKLVGKPASEIARDEKYRAPTMVLRSLNSGNLVRVYDVTKRTDVLGAKWCVMRFDGSDRCESVRMIGIPASTKTK